MSPYFCLSRQTSVWLWRTMCVYMCVSVHLFQDDNISSASQWGRQQLFYSSPRNRKSIHTQLSMFETSVSNCALPKWSQMSRVVSCHLALHIHHRQRYYILSLYNGQRFPTVMYDDLWGGPWCDLLNVFLCWFCLNKTINAERNFTKCDTPWLKLYQHD